jgi:protease IV
MLRTKPCTVKGLRTVAKAATFLPKPAYRKNMDNKKFAQNLVRNLSHNAGALLQKGLSLLPGEAPNTVYLELRGDYPVFAPKSPLPIPVPLPGQKKVETLEDLKNQLEAFGKTSCPELVLLERGFSGGFAAAFAIRQMLEKLVLNGKTVIFYADGYSNLSLYLASACTRVVALAQAEFLMVGLAARTVFQKETLKKIGIEIEYERRAEYKNAPNTFSENTFTAAHREALTSLVGSVQSHWLESIAKGRNLTPEAVKTAVDDAPLLAHEALDVGLASQLAFEDELTLNAKPLLEVLRFAPAPALRWGNSRTVALIEISGTIADGESKNNPLPIPLIGGKSAGGYSVARAIRQAEQDETIGAIVLVVDSPGGSALASELIWRAVVQAKRRKPVVAVMGDVAASGGYYVSCAANKIFAAPATITGSIGVFNIHFNNAVLWEKLGFQPEVIKFAENADYFSPDRPLNARERANMEKSVQHIYDVFKTRVADGRGLSLEAVEAVAKGRVWTGLQAFDHGLVDKIGSVFDAIATACDLAGMPEESDVQTLTPPAKFIVPTDVATMTQILQTRVWALWGEQINIR